MSKSEITKYLKRIAKKGGLKNSEAQRAARSANSEKARAAARKARAEKDKPDDTGV